MDKEGLSRRGFIQQIATAIIAVPVLAYTGKLFAVDLKKLPTGAKALDENAPMAKALGYKHQASQVDTKRYKKYQAGQSCKNCTLYKEKNGEWGECTIIKGGLVASTGWCNSYVLKKT